MDRPAETKDKNLPRVLVVDDEKAIQRFLKNALSSEEFSVHLAGSGKEALTAAIAIRPGSRHHIVGPRPGRGQSCGPGFRGR